MGGSPFNTEERVVHEWPMYSRDRTVSSVSTRQRKKLVYLGIDIVQFVSGTVIPLIFPELSDVQGFKSVKGMYIAILGGEKAVRHNAETLTIEQIHKFPDP